MIGALGRGMLPAACMWRRHRGMAWGMDAAGMQGFVPCVVLLAFAERLRGC